MKPPATETTFRWTRKHLLSLEQLSADEQLFCEVA